MTQQKVPLIDIEKYFERKKEGFVSVVPLGTNFTVMDRQFDPTTGQEVDPRIIPINVAQMLEQKEAYEKMVGLIDKFVEDLQAEGVKVSPETN